MSKKVKIFAPATSANLGPGFDILGVALQLFNEVTFESESTSWSSSKGSLRPVVLIEGEGAQSLPRNETNLVLRAAYKVFEKTNRWPKTLRVSLKNRVPLSRGMGSSAAATVGGIAGANALVGRPLSDQEVMDMAVTMEGHPDNVVPALVGGLCVSGTINRQTQYVKFNAPSGLRAVVCAPDRPLPTAEARRVLPSRVPFHAAVFTASRVAFLLGAFVQKQFDRLSFAMDDVLHQPARAPLVPGLKKVIEAAQQAGAYGTALSGAGSSVIAFTKPGPKAKRVAKAMEKAFAAHHSRSRSFELTLDNKGLRTR